MNNFVNRHPRGTRRVIAAVLVAAIASALTACESPLRPDYGNSVGNPWGGGNDPYTESLVAKAILQGADAGPPVASATIDGGVREWAKSPAGPGLVRVDEPGPARATEPVGFSASTQPSLATVSKIGLDAAGLNEEEPVVGLTLQDAIARTVKHALSIKVEAYNPAIKETQVIQAEAAFDATIFGQSQWTNNDDPQVTPAFTNGQAWQNQIGIRKLLPTGAQVQVSTDVTYRDTQVPFGTFFPLKSSYSTNVNLQVTQPLLRGFGTDVNQANIYLAQRDVKISLNTFKRQVITTVANVEEAYHNLVLTRTNVETLERLVISSEQTYNVIKERIGIDVTKASLNQAISALESRRADLHVAQKAYRQASDRLKGLMNDPDIDVRSNILVNPIDKPTTEPFFYNVPECIRTALQQRTELQEARLKVEQADIIITVAKNDLLPKLDLVAGVQTNGLDNGFDQAFSATVDPGNALDFSAGIKFEIPIGNRDAEAKLRQHQLERRQAIENIANIAYTVVLDVKQQLREVISTYQEIQIRDRVRISAAEEFEGILEIEDIRARTPEFLQLKLDSQQNLAQAEQQLTQAIVNYNLAIMRLEQAQGTLLEFNRISLDHPPITPDDNRLRFMGKTYNK